MALAPVVYQRRQPQKTVLYQVVQEHWATFVAQAEAADRWVPAHVEQEFDRFLTCGILAYGMAHVRCSDCGYSRLVALACKGRSLCPSCTGRRMSETAANLVDEVFPRVPVRQWVLTSPPPLRYRMAYDKQLCRDVLRCMTDAVFSWLRGKAKSELGILIRDAHPAGVTFIQRFGSALNLNIHFHTLLCDGVFVTVPGAPPQFRALPSPSNDETVAIASEIAERVMKLLRKRGECPDEGDDDFALQQPLLSACQSASVQGLIATGDRAGQRVLRFGQAINDDHPPQKIFAEHGFDLHNFVRVPAADLNRLEKLCRYAARPPLGAERLRKLADGRLSVKLKRPWSDGTTHIILTPTELLEKMVALVPPPRMHQVRYHGAFAPHAKLRSLVVPGPRDESCDHKGQLEMFGKDGEVALRGAADKSSQPASGRRLGWAKLMARVFEIDVLDCPRCHGGMQFVTWITDPAAIAAMLRSVGLSTAPPPIAPARGLQMKFSFAA